MDRKILVFIPMYNCEKQVVRVADQLAGPMAPYISGAVFVNNRSTDGGEAAIVEKLKSMQLPFPVKVLRNCENYGLGGSHKIAFNHALDNGYDYVIVLHGDDQGSIDDFLPLVRDGRIQEHDCWLGSRFMKGSRLPGYSKFRIFGNKVFNIIFSAATGKRIRDLGAGLNLYSCKMLASRFYHTFPDNLTFNCYMLFALASYRQDHAFVPISWREEDQVSNVKMARQAFQTLKMAAGYFFGRGRFLAKDARVRQIDAYASETVFEQEARI